VPSNSDEVKISMKVRHLMFTLGALAFLLLAIIFAPRAIAAEKMSGLKVGEKAPDFSLMDQNGNMRSLKDFAGKKSVVLYFYPKDDMGVCMQEACLFRDDYQAFVAAGAEVIGVSDDSVESHKHFVTHRKLPFVLLSDKHGKVRKLYGVPLALGGLLPGRVTFVIDPDGMVRLSFNSFMHADQHVSEALTVLKQIDKQAPGSK
jgi:thioredoxin-dependent peroxiredoxin